MIFVATFFSVPVSLIIGAILSDVVGSGIFGSFCLLGSVTEIPSYTFYYYKTKRYTKKCAFCFEKIKKEAVLCHHCGKEQPRKSDFQSFDDKLKYIFWVIVLIIILLFVVVNIISLM